MRLFLFVVLLFSLSFAANKATKPYTFSTGTIKASEVNKNYDSLYVPFNFAIDTLNKSVYRMKHFSNHDSVFRWMNIDTIGGKVHIDTIGWKVKIDTITNKVKIDTISNKVKIDTIISIDTSYSVAAKVRRAYIDTAIGRILTDSLDVKYTFRLGSAGAGGTIYCTGFNRPGGGGPAVYGSVDSIFRLGGHGDAILLTLNAKTSLVSTPGMVTASSGFTTNGEDTLTYNDTTFADSLFQLDTFRATVNARIIRNGKSITLYQPTLTGTLTTSTEAIILGIPIEYLPANDVIFIVAISNNSTVEVGELSFQDYGGIRVPHVFNSGGNYLSAGPGGVIRTVITWIIQ